ncbi:Mitochondrial transcription termination factor family protein [Euphorbia peplus]|nr:Mitochondrial transcription termination factor family protein [Euphorbia peplus]
MQENLTLTHSFISKPSFPPKPQNFHHDFRPKNLHFPSLSSKTITKPQTPKPQTPHFQEKTLFLDSIGIDIFSLSDHHRPILLSASLPDIKSIVDLFTSMGFNPPEFRRIISMCPEILTFNAADILPVFTFLLREANVKGSNLKHVIHRRPRLLVSSVKHRLRPTMYFLQSIGVEEVSRHTDLLSCSVEDKLLPRIDYFEKIGFTRKDVIAMFRRFPALFNYSVKGNIEPKLNYFVVEMGRDLRELKEFPQYFSFSLENRIKPRHQCCVEKGVYFPLRTLLKINGEQFRGRLELCCNSSIPLSSSPLFCTKIDFDSNTE